MLPEYSICVIQSHDTSKPKPLFKTLMDGVVVKANALQVLGLC